MGVIQNWSLVTVLLLTLQPNINPAVAELSQDIADLCPYSNFCTSTTNRTIDDPDLQSCCLPCSCRNDCGRIGKCCPGVEQSSAITMEYPCRGQANIYKSYLNITQPWKTIGYDAYRIVDGCPAEAFNETSLTDSVFRCYNGVKVEDLVFVTGSVSGYTYLNKHCAICNYDAVYTSWDLYTVNRSLLSTGMGFEERDRRILNYGGVQSVPPTHEIAIKAFCSETPKNTCNFTGLWDHFDRDLELKCKTVTVEYFPGIWRGWAYANIYCFLCNHPIGTLVPSACERITTNHIDGQSKGFGAAYSALLLWKPRIEEATTCAVGETLDSYRMRCTQLICPLGAVAQEASCVSMVEDVVGFTLSVAIEVHFDDQAGMASINHDNFLKDMIRLLMKTVNKGNVTCKMCEMETYIDPSSGLMYVVTYLRTTPTCSPSDLLRGISTLFNKSMVNKNLQNTRVLLKLVDGGILNTIFDKSLDLLATKNNEHCSSDLSIFSLGDVYCPSIQLTPTDMNEFAAHGHVESLITSKSVELHNGTLQLCLDDYILILKQAGLISGSQKRSGSNVMVYIGLLLALSMASYLVNVNMLD